MNQNTENVVQVVRYIRPYGFEEFPYGMHSNLYGITLVYTIDYDSRTVCVSWSICNNDNFDKSVGKNIAKTSKNSFSFSLEKVNEEDGLTNALILSLLDFTGEEYWPCDFEEIMNLFLKASRKMQ